MNSTQIKWHHLQRAKCTKRWLGNHQEEVGSSQTLRAILTGESSLWGDNSFGKRAHTDTSLGRKRNRLHIAMPCERVVSETLILAVH